MDEAKSLTGRETAETGTPKAIIVGGGIGGLTAGIALRQAGIHAVVYERAPELKEIGAGIALASNAMKVFSKLDLASQITACGAPLASGAIKTWNGKDIIREVEDAREFINVCVHRADLLRVLVQGLGEDNLLLGHNYVGFQESENCVVTRFANGEEVQGDLLVGADGLHSTIRSGIHGEEKPRYSGYTAWRGVAHFEAKAAISESWGHGKRFGIVPIGGGRVYWFATKNAPEGQEESPEDRKQELLDLFNRWHPPIADLIKSTEPGAILRHDLYDRKPLKRYWGEGRVSLLGDAAHATTPNLGQGACQSIEDAYVLAHYLRGAKDIAGALRRYEAKRMPRTTYITNLSWRLGRMAQWENSQACWLRNTILKAIPFSIQKKQLEKVLEFDPHAI